MPAHPPSCAVVDADAPDAADRLEEAIGSAEAVLVHRSGAQLLEGAPERLLRVLHRPHRRLVRVHSDAGSCYLARTELLVAAMRHGVEIDELVADAPGLDRRLAEASGAVHLDGPTALHDPAAGRWRVWVDGAVVGIGSAPDARAVGRAHSTPAVLLGLARRRAGRVRREAVRLRQRPGR
ncbi:hypothetical protein [Janibacter sp. G368]|uniref:hypothetical protein n=1 Tax=Janibacter sp. G368 TaxID=3420441 RepID=UPI003D0338AA